MIAFIKMMSLLVFLLFLMMFIFEGLNYRFKHPEKTETELFLDMIHLKWFK